MSNFYKQLDYHRTIDRYRFLTILNAANQCEEYQFAKQATMLWLVNYPGDLYVKYYQALSFAKSGKLKQGMLLFETIVELDPLFLEPLKALTEFSLMKEQNNRYKAIYDYLTKNNQQVSAQEPWLSPLWQARSKFEGGDPQSALQFIHQSIVNNPPTPIPAILHLNIANNMQNQEMLNNLSDIYYEKWPKCLQINIIKALAEMDQGKESSAVERLHWVEAQDNSGQVITRLLGNDHRFKDLWPDQLEAYFDLPVPASVSSFLGWNQLNSGALNSPTFKQSPRKTQPSYESTYEDTQKIKVSNVEERIKTKKKSPPQASPLKKKKEKQVKNEGIEEIQNAFSKIAKRIKKPDLDGTDNRFPVYVVLSSRKNLESVYGPNTADVIDNLLKEFISHIQGMPNWDGMIFYPDDSAEMTRMGLKPILAKDAWQVKLSLSDLDNFLQKQGEMIGALLIVGGPEIIPYHHLPNPTNDNDVDVPSDNPYGTIDENYFIPKWPVGRLPGEKGSDAGILLSQIRSLIYQYAQKSKKSKKAGKNISSIFTWILDLLSLLNKKRSKDQNLGYSAEIWKEASEEVYKTTGGTELQLSPPLHSGNLPVNHSNGHKLGYFNLHGIKEGPNWYGQKDFSSPSTGPDYPIALSPGMFNDKVQSPKLVFSEACYGANIFEKHHEEAISLKFLDSGTKSFIGSTCIAYGSVMPPLIAADYLAEAFWRQVVDGQAAGYALMQAKLNLVEEMTRKQGFLDGEDQKTILSFILFGDPLALHDGIKSMPKPILRVKSHADVKTISDSDMEPDDNKDHLPNGVSKEVEKIVRSYLPGLQNAEMKLNKSYGNIDNQTTGKTKDPQRYVVTLEKSIDLDNNIVHHHFARMTFDQKGKLVKFTTSR